MSSSYIVYVTLVNLLPFIIISTALAHFERCTPSFYNLITPKFGNTTHNCQKLTTLGAEFAWQIRKIRVVANNSRRVRHDQVLDVMFGAKLHSQRGWLAWGVNPLERPQMVGTRAVIGIAQPNESLTIDKYNITSDTKLGCRLKPSPIDIDVRNLSIVKLLDYFVISVSVVGLERYGYNLSRLSIVWQVGEDSDGDEPKRHANDLQHFDSTQTMDLTTIEYVKHVGIHRNRQRVAHGIMNIIGWGIVLPVGVMIARYGRYPIKLKRELWYFLHLSCQCIGYVLGTAGFGLGIWLGHVSPDYTFKTHRLLAILLFTFATLQMAALLLRPAEKDEHRKYWNMYHHFLGYALLAVMSINIFHGIAILKPEQYTWKWTYIGFLGLFAFIVITFEICSWVTFVRDRKRLTKKEKARAKPLASQSSKKGNSGGDGASEVNKS